MFADARQRHWEPLTANSPMLRRAADATGAQPTRGLSRGSRIFDLRAEERLAQRMEAENRELLPRLATILTAAQAQLYTKQREQQVQSLRQRTLHEQRELRVGPNRQLDPAEHLTKVLAATTQLDLRLRINDSAVHQTLLSVAGSPVTLEAPEGLFVSATPSLTAEDNLAVELQLYETSSRGRALIGRETRVIFTPEAQPRLASAGLRTQRSLLRGHKAYLLEWSVVAQFR